VAVIPTDPNGTFVFSVQDRKSNESEKISLHSGLKAGVDYFCMTKRDHIVRNDGLKLPIKSILL
jgi:hypothetical protein